MLTSSLSSSSSTATPAAAAATSWTGRWPLPASSSSSAHTPPQLACDETCALPRGNSKFWVRTPDSDGDRLCAVEERVGDTPRVAAAEAPLRRDGGRQPPSSSALSLPQRLSPNAFVQVQQQQERRQRHAHQLRRRCAAALRGDESGASRGADDTADDSAVWSHSSSILPHSSGNAGTASRSDMSDSTGSGMEVRRRRPTAAPTRLGGVDRRAPPPGMDDDDDDDDAETESSSCGCPTSCSCRSGRELRHMPPAHLSCAARATGNRASARVTPRCSRAADRQSSALDATRVSDASSETGATPPAQRSSDEDGDEVCSACRLSCRATGRRPPLVFGYPVRGITTASGGTGSSASLCSSCAAAAAAPVRMIGGGDAFTTAVHRDTLVPEVPPLLYLAAPAAAAARCGRVVGDAAVVTLREREERRLAYLRSAAALAGSAGGLAADGSPAGDGDAASLCGRLEPQLCGTPAGDAAAAAVEAAAAEETRRRAEQQQQQQQQAVELARTAAAHCVEVALPALHGELADVAARSAAQQQERMDALAAQLRVLHEELLTNRKHTEEQHHQQQQQRLLEHRRREEEEAARQRPSRVDSATSPLRAAPLSTEAAVCVPAVTLPPAPPRRSVAVQHADGSLELLAAVRQDAARWTTALLCAAEVARRDALVQDEAELRLQLLCVLEEPCRRRTLHCEAQVLRGQAECLALQQRTTAAFNRFALEQSERLARQHLTSEAAAAHSDIRTAHVTERLRASDAAARHSAETLAARLADTQAELAALQSTHADTLEHVRHLRVQLIEALRMPTVTLADRASAPVHAARSGGGRDGGVEFAAATSACATTAAVGCESGEDMPVHRRFARAHQEALRVTRAQHRAV
ncbi:hypothetical protein NESM_000208700 [Novymonas esmeraldas]|uniref:Uncharacterized protein n=1 Tax=Novymonas esmeraldas TaxID=1808958 RepID=A0AAW0F6T1_9TRYP